MEISIIAAVASNGVIGRKNALPWKMRDDLAFFKSITEGKVVLMGKNTYKSLGKALPNRRNIVLCSDDQYASTFFPDAEVYTDITEALQAVNGCPSLLIIGGASIYSQFLPLATTLFITEIGAKVEGDTYFPAFDKNLWNKVVISTIYSDDNNDFNAEIVRYDRKWSQK